MVIKGRAGAAALVAAALGLLTNVATDHPMPEWFDTVTDGAWVWVEIGVLLMAAVVLAVWPGTSSSESVRGNGEQPSASGDDDLRRSGGAPQAAGGVVNGPVQPGRDAYIAETMTFDQRHGSSRGGEDTR